MRRGGRKDVATGKGRAELFELIIRVRQLNRAICSPDECDRRSEQSIVRSDEQRGPSADLDGNRSPIGSDARVDYREYNSGT